jgi:16S rRNA G966 N2-methylase RsmD
MVNLNDFLNKRFSTRELTDQEFENIVGELAEEIAKVSYVPTYTNQQLLDDWEKLCQWSTNDNYINSTSRIGMKLCEHFFPNFYDIQNNRGDSFANLWNKENLIKILRWNRKSHSTPYLSELKRGIYFCCGLTKNTMYRPQMAKAVCLRYQPKIVLDPCAGWAGRMLGAVASGANYIAFEPNTKTYDGILEITKLLNIEDKVRIICDDVLNIQKYDLPKVDLVITSPPYFDLEIYADESTQSITNFDNYEMWSEKFLKVTIDNCLDLLNQNGVSCWNVGKVGKKDMNDDVKKYHLARDFNIIENFSVISSKRQSLQSSSKNEKSSDDTVIYGITPVLPL